MSSILTAKQIEDAEAKAAWASKPVAVIENTTSKYIQWDINGTGTCTVWFEPNTAVTASAMQMEGMTNPPRGIVVRRYDFNNRQHIRLKRIGG